MISSKQKIASFLLSLVFIGAGCSNQASSNIITKPGSVLSQNYVNSPSESTSTNSNKAKIFTLIQDSKYKVRFTVPFNDCTQYLRVWAGAPEGLGADAEMYYGVLFPENTTWYQYALYKPEVFARSKSPYTKILQLDSGLVLTIWKPEGVKITLGLPDGCSVNAEKL